MAEPTGRRARNRAARHDQLLAAAGELVTEHGLDGLTMQAVADKVDCAVGTIYTYFDSKSALVAALQTSAIQTLMGTYHRSAARWDEVLERPDIDDAVASLARLLGFGHLFLAWKDLHPREFEFLQMLVATPVHTVTMDDARAVVPHALALLNEGRVLIDAAMATGALAPTTDRPADDSLTRTLRWAGGLNGALMVGNTGGEPSLPDPAAFDGTRLALLLSEDLLIAWGAPLKTLEEARKLVEEMRVRGELLPVGETD